MKNLMYVLLVFVLGAMPALAADAGTFTSVRASKDVALETNPKSAFWQGSDPIFIVNDNWGKPVPGYRTEVFSRWTKDNLYLLYVCPYRKAASETESEHDGGDKSVVELGRGGNIYRLGF